MAKHIFKEGEFHNIERFCKRFNLVDLAQKENQSGQDFVELMDKMYEDTKKNVRNVRIVEGIGYAMSAATGILAGYGIAKGIKDENRTAVAVTAAGSIAALATEILVCSKITNRMKGDVHDNALYAQQLADVVREHIKSEESIVVAETEPKADVTDTVDTIVDDIVETTEQ